MLILAFIGILIAIYCYAAWRENCTVETHERVLHAVFRLAPFAVLIGLAALAGCASSIEPPWRDYNYRGQPTRELETFRFMQFDRHDISTEGWHINRYACEDYRAAMICADSGGQKRCQCVL